jgi:hypothetical protein
MYLLLNMKEFSIVKAFENEVDAENARDLPEHEGLPMHVVNKTAWDLSGTDMVKFYNNIPGVTPVTRFATKAVGQDRLNKALGEQPSLVADISNVDQSLTVEEKPVKTKKTRAVKAPKVKSAATRSRLPEDAVIKPTAAGIERTWHKESARGKLFAHLLKKESMTVGELVRYGTQFLELKAGQVLALIGKILDPKAAGGASAVAK